MMSAFGESEYQRWYQEGYDWADPFARCAYTNLSDAYESMHSTLQTWWSLSEADKSEADEAFGDGFEKRMREMLKTREVADGLGVAIITIKRWVKNGGLKPDIHHPKLNLFSWDTVHAFRASHPKYAIK